MRSRRGGRKLGLRVLLHSRSSFPKETYELRLEVSLGFEACELLGALTGGIVDLVRVFVRGDGGISHGCEPT